MPKQNPVTPDGLVARITFGAPPIAWTLIWFFGAMFTTFSFIQEAFASSKFDLHAFFYGFWLLILTYPFGLIYAFIMGFCQSFVAGVFVYLTLKNRGKLSWGDTVLAALAGSVLHHVAFFFGMLFGEDSTVQEALFIPFPYAMTGVAVVTALLFRWLYRNRLPERRNETLYNKGEKASQI